MTLEEVIKVFAAREPLDHDQSDCYPHCVYCDGDSDNCLRIAAAKSKASVKVHELPSEAWVSHGIAKKIIANGCMVKDSAGQAYAATVTFPELIDRPCRVKLAPMSQFDWPETAIDDPDEPH